MLRLSLVCSLAGLVAIYVAATSARPLITPIASLDNGFIGLSVTVSGQVVDSREHRDGHLFLKLRDDSGGVISVPIFSRLRAELGEPIELLDVLEVTGEVVLYQGELEIVPELASDVEVAHTAPVSLSSLSEENAGAMVKVQETMVELEQVDGGSVLLVLQGDDSQLHIFIPSRVADDGLPQLRVGDTVCVGGWLQMYNGELELKVVNASDLHIVEAV